MQTNITSGTAEAATATGQVPGHGKKRSVTDPLSTTDNGFSALMQALLIGQSLHPTAHTPLPTKSTQAAYTAGLNVSTVSSGRETGLQRRSGEPVFSMGQTTVGARKRAAENLSGRSETAATSSVQGKATKEVPVSGFPGLTTHQLSRKKPSETDAEDKVLQGKPLSDADVLLSRSKVGSSTLAVEAPVKGNAGRAGVSAQAGNEIALTNLPQALSHIQAHGVARADAIHQTSHTRHLGDEVAPTDGQTVKRKGQEANTSSQQWMPGAIAVNTQHGATAADHSGQTATISIADPDMHQQFASLLAQQVKAGTDQISVKVHPAGMGDIVVTVGRQAEGVQVHVEANNQQTVALLTQQTAQITDAIRSLGIDLTDVQVSYGQASLSQHSGGSFQGDQGQAHQEQQANRWLGAIAETSTRTTGHLHDQSDWLSGTINVRV